MPEDADFITEIQADPYLGQARLIYADWLDERGDIRGQFLRKEVAYTKLDLKSEPAKQLFDQLVETALGIDSDWINDVGYRYDFRILSFGGMKLDSVKTVKMMTGATLMQAKTATEQAPATLIYSIPFHGMVELCSSQWFPKFTRENYNEEHYKDRQLPEFEFRVAMADDVGPTEKRWAHMQRQRNYEERDGMGMYPADLYMTGFGSDRIKAMAIVRELVEGTLSEAKQLVENCPSLIQEQLYRSARLQWQTRINRLLARYDSDAAFDFVVNNSNKK